MSLDISLFELQETCVFDANITHNLGAMAEYADIYGILWRPEEHDIYVAGQLIKPLDAAIQQMKRFPSTFEKLNHPNGWGTYEVFVPWLERLLEACKEHPYAKIQISR